MTGTDDWADWLDAEIDAIRAAGRWRTHRRLDACGPVGVLDGQPVVSFASNDYLGLSAHPAVCEAAVAAVARWGTGATASRLVVGNRPVHDDLEAALAEWKGCEAALVLPTGYQANLAVLTTVAAGDVSVLSDELNHASIIDGLRLARARLHIYPHNDVEAVARLMADARGRVVVVTDAVFSMDGDTCHLFELVELCARRGALLVVDEAHNVLGPDLPHQHAAVLRVGTLSKTLGSLGGFVAGPHQYINLILNRARSHIFTTGLSPADAAAGLAGLQVLRSPEGAELVARLRQLVDRVKPAHPSPILPVIVGDEAAAVAAAAALLERGILVPAIRPPTVAPGSSRLRVTLSAAHTDAQVADLLAALADLGLQP
jgi:8-amino-7-oxononanoate synthase